MRVIAGHLRSRVLVSPPGKGTRPTSDRLRETLFNVLSARVPGSRFADLYAGSGAVGIEALSRGAASCFLVEQGRGALEAIWRNLQQLELQAQAEVSARPVAQALADAGRAANPFDVVFLDPPYEAEEEYAATLSTLGAQTQSLLSAEALVVAEHARRSAPGEVYGRLRRTRLLEQGDAALSFYREDLR